MPETPDQLELALTRLSHTSRLVLFHARRQVALRGGNAIEPEHLLLGILRADRRLLVPHLRPEWTVARLRASLKAWFTSAGPKLPEHVELPFAPAVAALVVQAAELADRLGSRHLEPSHLLVLLQQDEASAAGQVLSECCLATESMLETMKVGRRPD